MVDGRSWFPSVQCFAQILTHSRVNTVHSDPLCSSHYSHKMIKNIHLEEKKKKNGFIFWPTYLPFQVKNNLGFVQTNERSQNSLLY